MRLRPCLSTGACDPATDGSSLAGVEEGARALIEAEELQEVRALVTRTRLAVTELVDRARLGRMYSMELRAAGQLLRLISLELVQREVVCAAECIQRLEAEERLSLLEAEHRLCGSLHALHGCHDVLFCLQRLRGDEAAARAAFGAAARLVRTALFDVAREPLLRYQCMTSEVVERDVLYKSLRLFNLEHQKRKRLEAMAAAKHPNIEVWLLMTAAQRERLWLLACQQLQRNEMAARRRILNVRLVMIHRARQQCVRPFVEQQLALLDRQEGKARKLVAALETLPRAMLSAKRMLHVAMQKRRDNVAATESRDRQVLGVLSACAVEAYVNRQKVAAHEQREWAHFLRTALPTAVVCRNSALQVLEGQRRDALEERWQFGCQWLRLMTVGIAESETARRANLWRRFCMDNDLFALQRQELDCRSAALSRVLAALQTSCGRFRQQMALWLDMERGRDRVGRDFYAGAAQLRHWHCLELEALGRQDVQRASVGFLWYLYGCYTLEAVEIKVRRGLQAEQLAAFGVIQRWWGLMDGIERLFSAGRTALGRLEGQERNDLYNSARISQRMAKVSTDLRISQQSRDGRRADLTPATPVHRELRKADTVPSSPTFRDLRRVDTTPTSPLSRDYRPPSPAPRDPRKGDTTPTTPILQRGSTMRVGRVARVRVPTGAATVRSDNS